MSKSFKFKNNNYLSTDGIACRKPIFSTGSYSTLTSILPSLTFHYDNVFYTSDKNFNNYTFPRNLLGK